MNTTKYRHQWEDAEEEAWRIVQRDGFSTTDILWGIIGLILFLCLLGGLLYLTVNGAKQMREEQESRGCIIQIEFMSGE